MIFTTLGITWEQYSHVIHNFGIQMGNIPMLFTTLGINCRSSYNIFPKLGYQQQQSLFPKKNPFKESWALTTPQKYPKKGI